MANVNIKFNGKEYLLSCDDGQEEHLQELSEHLTEKFNSLKSSLGSIGENKLLLITSITVMDEYFETKKNVDKKKIELQNLTEKFKELKSLIYDYKDVKEKQISELTNEQIALKNEIEKSVNEYEKIIENTTLKLENFLEKVNTDKSVQ
tara:strand:- start:109 stop:555 length:447 start_codon:yes stop_codon:yes gene_type:complete